jgi:hypothetical protein
MKTEFMDTVYGSGRNFDGENEDNRLDYSMILSVPEWNKLLKG